MLQAASNALFQDDKAGIGQTESWSNPKTGNSGAVSLLQLPAPSQMGGCTSTAAGVRMTSSIEGGFNAVPTQEGERRLALVRELQRLAQGAC
jgi:hypothetical protein